MIWQLLDSSNIGGIESHVATLTAALNKAGLPSRVVLWKQYRDNPWRQRLIQNAIPFDELSGRLRDLHQHMTTSKPALIHTHGYKANIIGRALARLHTIPAVSSFHAGETGKFPVSLYQALDVWTSCLAKRIAVSEAIRAKLPFQTSVVGNFIAAPDPPIHEPLPRRIAFIGRLSPEKGPDLFCRIAKDHQHLATWHVYGDGPMRAELESAYAQTIKFHGMQTNIAAVLEQTGLLFMPSRAEGLPMAALEAMAAGVPVLASRVGALPELITENETGWLIQSGDVAAAGDKLHTWAKLLPPAQLKMRQACWQRITARYSISARLPEVLKVYSDAGFPT